MGRFSVAKDIAITVKTKIQGTYFSSSFYVLSLGGCDVVLGVKWLQSLGLIVWNFSQLTIKFVYEGKEIQLVGLGLKELNMEGSNK